KIDDHFEREKLVNLLRGLGDGFKIGITPELVSVVDIDEGKLLELVAALAKPQPMTLPGAPQKLFYVGKSIARADALSAGTAVVDEAKKALSALMAIYRFIAW